MSRHVPCPGTGFGAGIDPIRPRNRLTSEPSPGAGLTPARNRPGDRDKGAAMLLADASRWVRSPPCRPCPRSITMRQLATSRTAEIPQIASIPTPGSVSLAASLHDPKGLARRLPGPSQSDLSSAFPTGLNGALCCGRGRPRAVRQMGSCCVVAGRFAPLEDALLASPYPLGSLS